MNRLIRQFQRHLRKQWIRGFRGDKCQPSVRAVLLGDFVSEIIVLDGEFEGAQLAAFESGLFPGLRGGMGEPQLISVRILEIIPSGLPSTSKGLSHLNHTR